MYKKLKYELTGVGKGLMQGNARMANPFDEFAVALSKVNKKRPKSEEDIKEEQRLQFMGALYVENGVPVIPGEIMIATIAHGNPKNQKTGQLNTRFRLNLVCTEGFFPLKYVGPKTPEGLWKEKNKFAYTRLQEGRLKTNPIFPQWKAVIKLKYDDGELDEKDVDDALVRAGKAGYLMAWQRGGWGKFEVKKI